MNRTEVTNLCRTVKALCPSQVFDQFTPDAWALVLGAYSYDDAQQAIREIAGAPLDLGKSRYIEPGHIIAGVRRIRGKRLEATPMPSPPAGLTDAGYIAWDRETREAIASGTYSAQPSDRTPADPERVRAILAGATAKRAENATEATTDDTAAEKRRQIDALNARIAKEAAS